MAVASVIEKNKTLVYTVAAIAAVGSGLGLYYALSSSRNSVTTTSQPNEQGGDNSAAGSKKKKKKKAKGKKEGEAKASTIGGFPLKKDKDVEYPEVDDFAAVEALPEATKKELALSFKTAGNYYFKEKDYNRAVELYSEAIKCDPKDAIYYSNRAACYNSLQNYEKVVEDTTSALNIDPEYVKCYSRRAVAYEKLENFSDSLLDFTSACILNNFQDKSLNASVDRVLKLNAVKIVQETYENKPKKLPSGVFMNAFFRSFRKRELPDYVKDAAPGSADYKVKLAFDALSQEVYEAYELAFKLFSEAIDEGAESLALALEYRGTLNFLADDLEQAEKDILKSIELKPTPQAHIKLSSIHIEQRQDPSVLSKDFENALALDNKCADVYYHRAQVAFLTDDFNSAIRDYKESLALDDTFVFTHIQLAVSQYRMDSAAVAIKSFQDLIKKWPQESDIHNYYGEILLDQGNYTDAFKEFDTAIDLEKNRKSGSVNVLPIINKALATFQALNDLNEAEKLCREAYAIDPKSEVVVGTLAQICLQQDKIEEAYKYFIEQVDLARTDSERINSLSYAGAAQTQIRLNRERPALKQRLTLLAAAGRISG